MKMNRQMAGIAFLVFFFGLMFGLVLFTDLGWLVSGAIGVGAGALVGGFIAERSRG
jgi:hypothetical protein